MMREVNERAPHAVIEGVTLQRMIRAMDYELILRSKRHKDFGSIIFLGMGGRTAELVRDFSIACPLLTRHSQRRLLEETKAYR